LLAAPTAGAASLSGGRGMRQRNIIAAVVLIIGGLAYGTLALDLPERSLPNTPGPRFFPLVVAAIILASAVTLLLLQAQVASGAGEAGANASSRGADRRLVLLALAALAAYAASLPVLGFILATVPFLAILMVLFGERRPVVVVVSAIAVAAALYVVFRYGFGIFLPRGPLAGIVA
jgi:putative tricarboxylic transport membrane protein